MVEQYYIVYTKFFCAEKSNFSKAFSDIEIQLTQSIVGIVCGIVGNTGIAS